MALEEGWLFIIIIVESLIYACDETRVQREVLDLLANMLKSKHGILVHPCVIYFIIIDFTG